MTTSLVDSNRARLARIEAGEQVVVGENRFTESEASPLTADAEGGILVVDPALEAEQVQAVRRWRTERDEAPVQAALAELARIAADESTHENLMIPSIAAARAGATTGEWAATLRGVFGSYRAPTGVAEAAASSPRGPSWSSPPPRLMPADPATAGPRAEDTKADGDAAAGRAALARELTELREEVSQLAERLGRRPKMLVGKPGLDGHSNGAEQIAVKARDSGLDVVYEGIRLTPTQIAASALQEGVHVIGLSILSGSHRQLIPAVMSALQEAGVSVPVVVGGIIPERDVAELRQGGVAAVYTPKDFDITRVMREVVALVAETANGTGDGRAGMSASQANGGGGVSSARRQASQA
jgi:(2R)-ethylmalonyl-CoA mutase